VSAEATYPVTGPPKATWAKSKLPLLVTTPRLLVPIVTLVTDVPVSSNASFSAKPLIAPSTVAAE
jgi:hypothetical protein